MLHVQRVQDLPDVIFALQGELDLTTLNVLRAEVEQLNLDQIISITFRLDGLEFIDSTGIGQLIGYYREFGKRNLPVHLVNNNQAIEEILEMIGVRKIMST